MDFEKMLSHQIDMIDVPDELSPDNIAAMLKQLPQTNTENKRSRITMNTGRTLAMRGIAAAAALTALAAGFLAYTDKSTEPVQLGSEIVYKDVEQPHSYNDLFDIYTQIYLSGSQPQDIAGSISDADAAANDIRTDGFSGAATVRAENGAVYYLSGGKIYSLSADGARLCADVSSKKPIEMYVADDRLILVSEQDRPVSAQSLQTPDVPADGVIAAGSTADTDPDGQQTGAVRYDSAADIYDISGGTAEFLGSFTQSGRYVSSRISDGRLYMVTCYTDYRSKPLGEESDLDNYVPYYLLGSDKKYVAPDDITVPSNAASTDYTVVSAMDTAAVSDVSVKAVLGSSRKIFCTDTTLYTAGVGRTDTDYTALTAFDISGGGIEYKASGSVEGTILRYGGFGEYGGELRVVTAGCDADGITSTNIFVLDDSLSVTRSAGRLLPGAEHVSVSFAERYAVLKEQDKESPSLIVDLSSDPPVAADDMMNSGCSVFFGFGGDLTAGLGRTDTGLVLTMFSADGSRLADISFAEGADVSCEAFTKRKAVFADPESGLIGVPVSLSDEFGVHGRYCLFSYGDDGFTEKGSIEYSDTDESCVFRSAAVSGDVLYAVSDSRIVLARLSDMKVIDCFDIE